MLEIKCTECDCKFWIEGYIHPANFMEPSEVVIDDDALGNAIDDREADGEFVCDHLKDGGGFDVTDEEYDR